MKTKLLTICLLLFTSQVFAECNDELVKELYYRDAKGQEMYRWVIKSNIPT